MTPPLGAVDYLFPVVGDAFFGDTYGAPRSDVPSGWHHGDDIFAPFGAPVVAVADGTVTRVGWERLGGWRLWVHDALGNEFYYAHLSAYTPLALHATRVKAGQVLGFIGDTGDAITTPFHLHFEVHPASLLYLGEDGAVDPTGYLEGWRHLRRVQAPRPVHPPLPAGAFGEQAERVFRQLVAARRLIRDTTHKGGVRPSRPLAVAMNRRGSLAGPLSVTADPRTWSAPARPHRLTTAGAYRLAQPAPPASPPPSKGAPISSRDLAVLAVVALMTLSSLFLLRRSGWRPWRRVLASRSRDDA